MPNNPSLPANSPHQSGPTFSRLGPPHSTTSPVANTAFNPRTWLEVIPYFRQWAPPELKATLPPMVQIDWLEGSGAKCKPWGAAATDTCVFTTPGSTTAMRNSG